MALLSRPSMLAAPVAVSVLLAGCGIASFGPAAQGRSAGAFGARAADVPEIAAQIQAATLSKDEHGTRVKRLPVPSKPKDVTFFTFKALDNNLGVTLPMHLNTLEKAGSNAGVNAVVLTDDIGPNNSRWYYITQDRDLDTISSPWTPVGKRGEVNSGSGGALASAMRTAFGSYPSRMRWLDVNNHGGGYYGIAQDDRSDAIIRLPQLATALNRGRGARKIDLLTFDACLMATIEVAHELRNTAEVMVASEDSSYALGMNYDTTLAALARGAKPDPAALGRDIVLRAQRKGNLVALFTISALDLSQASRTTQAVDRLGKTLLAAMPTHGSQIKRALAAVKPFYVAGPDQSDFNHRDLHEVLVQLRERITDRSIQAACAGVQATLFNKNGLILLSRAAREEAKVPRGVSIYLPLDGKVDPIYKNTAFARDTSWDEFLAAVR
ncbi:MAG: clostripain-related cysteine peptidase [Candidatus Sericytochromatia bacterium]|nr:clostripain-related cysteine peptidase [Candidatus Sericytochromatia bacterium]